MSEKIEVYFSDRIGPYRNGQVAEFDEHSPFLKAILLGKKAVVLNPPDWEFGDDKAVLRPVPAPAPKPEPKVEVEVEVEVEITEPVEEEADGEGDIESTPDSEDSTEDSTSDQGHGAESPERVEEDAPVSPKRYGGSGNKSSS